jgi:hypothetical protein
MLTQNSIKFTMDKMALHIAGDGYCTICIFYAMTINKISVRYQIK